MNVEIPKKYQLTDHVVWVCDRKLYRIRAVRAFGMVPDGAFGGYVESENNLDHGDDCWVGDRAMVYGSAKVTRNAVVSGRAEVYERAIISDYAKVYGDAHVYGDSLVSGYSLIHGNARVFGYAVVKDTVAVLQNAKVGSRAILGGSCTISGDSAIA